MMEKMYLVTGAAGFLGSAVCRKLVEEHQEVRGLVLPNDKSAKYLPQEVQLVYGDLCDMESLEKLFSGLEKKEIIVLHIASIVTVNPNYSQIVMDVNVGGTKNIIALCQKYQVKKLVYCSSTGAIPEEQGNRIEETNGEIPLDVERIKGCYSLSKALATNAVLESAQCGLNATVVHPSGILGPFDYAKGETTKTLVDIIRGEMPAGIDGTFNLCDVRDLAQGILSAAEKGRAGECYILANEAVSFREFAHLVSTEGNCKSIKWFLPLKFANLLAKYMEHSAKRKNKKPMMTTFSIYNLARNNNFSSEKAKRELGYQTRPYSETIRDEVQWLQEVGWIG